MNSESPKKEGLRERKRCETLHRIADEGLRLFVENGYDATTLEAVAAASGISARTLFYYFKTKDEILHFWQGDGFMEALGPVLLEETTEQEPLDAVRNCLLKLISHYETEKSVIVDRIWNSTEALRARKQVIYIQMDQIVFSALCALWPHSKRRPSHRMIAMVSIGVMRLAMEARRQNDGARSLAQHLQERFAGLGKICVLSKAR